MPRLLFTLLFVLSFSATSIGQTFLTKESLNDTLDNQLFLNLESTSFIKNNEYFGEFTEGFTGIGFFIKPTLNYHFTKDFKASAGVHFLKYSGLDQFTQVIPLFSIQHKLNDKLDIVLGNLYSSLNHEIEEPLYRFDRYYQNNIEYGLQLLYDSKRVKSDLWLDWRKFILKNDPFQEVLVFGNNTNIDLIVNEKYKLIFPFQFLIHHKGGQIDSSPDPVSVIMNGDTGLKFKYSLGRERQLGIDALYFLYQGNNLPETGVNSQVYDDGSALYLKLNYSSNKFNALLAYWTANQFIAPDGEYLFLSVSETNNSFQKERQLITSKIALKKKISDYIKLELRADGYYDLDNENFDYSMGLYFVIDQGFFLGSGFRVR